LDMLAKEKGTPVCAFSLALICLLPLSGCVTDWRDAGGFFQTIETELVVESTPEGEVFINNQHVGVSPLRTSLEYQQEIKKKKRKVSYWRTQPGSALAFTVLSLGLYLPFSAIPVDIESTQEPTDSFRGNEFVVRIESTGYRDWKKTIRCRGEPQLELKPELVVFE
ncbi:MAG: hypothetical protein KIT39_20905, partial [Nitrospirales bacterium]|nr:hypothetical protein [Nitrospirales bacterium]